jgi:phosphoglycolate phosphatase
MEKTSISGAPGGEVKGVAPTLLLDLDGTIVDSLPDLNAALNRLLARRGLKPLTPAETAPMVGDGVAKLVERALAARGQVADTAAVAEYAEDYGHNYACQTRLFPGVAETLAGLRAAGWKLAVCTNKLEEPAWKLLDILGVGHLFAAIGGGDSFPVRKPDPAHLLSTLRASGGQPGHAVLAGDHRNDIAAATGAGLPCIFAAWGYGSPDMAKGAAEIAHHFDELPRLASRLLGLGR